LIRKKALASPDLFIHAVPHMSFVHGAAHVAYLKRRYAALTAHHLYRGMEFTEDKQTLRDWFPLVMGGRPDSDIIAATRMITGADVNYGALTRSLIGYLQTLTKRLRHSLFASRHRAQPRGRRPLAHRNDRCGQQRTNIDHRKIRLSRRRRRRLAAPSEIGDSGSERLRRLPGQRHLAALR
jgi:malate dehydrogenase (quinone)